MGIHPTGDGPRHHEISLMSDDLEQTVTDLTAKGARFTGEIETTSFGRTIMMAVPGADDILVYEPSHPTVYEPSHPTAYDL